LFSIVVVEDSTFPAFQSSCRKSFAISLTVFAIRSYCWSNFPRYGGCVAKKLQVTTVKHNYFSWALLHYFVVFYAYYAALLIFSMAWWANCGLYSQGQIVLPKSQDNCHIIFCNYVLRSWTIPVENGGVILTADQISVIY
jgi:hypothetical protein